VVITHISPQRRRGRRVYNFPSVSLRSLRFISALWVITKIGVVFIHHPRGAFRFGAEIRIANRTWSQRIHRPVEQTLHESFHTSSTVYPHYTPTPRKIKSPICKPRAQTQPRKKTRDRRTNDRAFLILHTWRAFAARASPIFHADAPPTKRANALATPRAIQVF